MISQTYLLKEMSNLLKANKSISIQKTNTLQKVTIRSVNLVNKLLKSRIHFIAPVPAVN